MPTACVGEPTARDAPFGDNVEVPKKCPKVHFEVIPQEQVVHVPAVDEDTADRDKAIHKLEAENRHIGNSNNGKELSIFYSNVTSLRSHAYNYLSNQCKNVISFRLLKLASSKQMLKQ